MNTKPHNKEKISSILKGKFYTMVIRPPCMLYGSLSVGLVKGPSKR